MTKALRFSIISACKGRLDHLKQTLPAMLQQADAEVIVVDFSCPQDTAGFVTRNYPAARVVKIEDKNYFSNWEARNAGAASAQGEWLLFCDADIVLDERCTKQLGEILAPGNLYKFKPGRELERHRPTRADGLGANSLQGFQVVDRGTFERLRGYDTRLRGYGAGGDTEFYRRAMAHGLRIAHLDESLVHKVIEHGDELRQAHTSEFWFSSYLRGFYYDRLKLAFTNLQGHLPSEELCDVFFKAAEDATRQVLTNGGSVDVTFPLDRRKLQLAPAAGYSGTTVETLLTVRVNLKKP
jgi:glycosyltransferase involved in cell wall biosynthesis